MKLAALLVTAVTVSVAACPAIASAQTLNVVGSSDLGGGGANGEVAVVGNTAIVAAGVLAGGGLRSGLYNPAPCPTRNVKVVDLTNPAAPSVASTIPVPDGQVAQDVAALRVSTPSFTGDLAAVALVTCRAPGQFTDRGVAYYNVTNRASPQFLGRYDADFDRETPSDPPCGPPPGGSGARCASSQDEVALVQRPDGRVLSLSTEPFASAAQFPSGDLRVVDVTNPAFPTQVGSFPNGGQQPPPYFPPGGAANPRGFSHNGCRPFDGAIGVGVTAGGSRALLPYFDHGMLIADLSNPGSPTQLGQLPFPRDDRAFEGNAARVAPASANGRSLALLSESDYIAPETRLRIDAPASLAGSKFACESMFTLFDPEDTAQIYRKAGGQLPGEIVYVGRGCPSTPNDDPYLNANVAGKIVLRDRSTIANRQTGLGRGCSAAAAVKRAQDAGAVAVITAQTSVTTPEAFSFDGDPADLTIPMVQIDKGDADALRDALCPVPDSPNSCGPGGQTVSGSMVDSRGSWGRLRVADITNPAAPTQVGEYSSPRAGLFPPPDLGVYSIHHAVARENLAYVAANSDGVRIVDVACATPNEIGSFVPADTADPTGFLPRKAFVTGVDVGPGGTVVITDINSGLYVLSAPQGRACPAGPGPGAGGPGGPGDVVPKPGTPRRVRVRPNLLRPGGSASQVGRRVVVRVRGRMRDNRGRSCAGRVKMGVRFARSRRVVTGVRMGANCRYSKRVSFPVRRLPRALRARRKVLVVRVAVRFQGNAGLLPDVSPTRRIKVRRRR